MAAYVALDLLVEGLRRAGRELSRSAPEGPAAATWVELVR